MDEDDRAPGKTGGTEVGDAHKPNGIRLKNEDKSSTTTPNDSNLNSRAPSLSPDQAKSASDTASTPDNGSAPKLARKASKKNVRSAPQLFDHLPDVKDEACSTFQVINDCLYGSRNMGATEHDALDCDCAEEWRTFSFSLPLLLPLPLPYVVFSLVPCLVRFTLLARHPPPDTPWQMMSKITPVARTRTVSTGRPRWNAWTAIAIVETVARTSGFSGSNMPTSRSSRQKTRGLVSGQIQLCSRTTSFSSTLARSSMNLLSGTEWLNTTRKVSSTFISCH